MTHTTTEEDLAYYRALKKTGKLLPRYIKNLDRTIPGWDWTENKRASWAKFITHLDEFVAEFTHANVPKRFVSADGYKLGSHVGSRRKQRATLSPYQMTELEGRRGWVWDASAGTPAEAWAKFITHLDEFVAEFGHANVPRKFVSADGYKLGQHASNKRARRATLSPYQMTELEGRRGWVWEASAGTPAEVWAKFINHLDEFIAETGHANVPRRFVSADGYKLGSLVSYRRVQRATLRPDQVTELESRQGWVWVEPQDAPAEARVKLLTHLDDFIAEMGHANVPFRFVSADGYKLGKHVSTKRSRRATLRPDRVTELESRTGWLWSAPRGGSRSKSS